jgi:hypothetical protein
VPGVGTLDHPPGSGLQREALLADHTLTAQFGQQVAGVGAVVAGVEVHGDRGGQVEPEPAQLLQCGAQQGRVVPVGWGDHAAQRDPMAVGQHRSLGALLSPVNGGLPGGLTATRRLHQAAVHGEVAQLQADDAVVGV